MDIKSETRPYQLPAGYEELKPGDIIQTGDLILPWKQNTWKKAAGAIGAAYKDTAKLNSATIVVRKQSNETAKSVCKPVWKPEVFSMYVIGAGETQTRRAETEKIIRKYLPYYLYGGSGGNDFYILHDYHGRNQVDFYQTFGSTEGWKQESCFNDVKVISYHDFIFHFTPPEEKKRKLRLDLSINLRETLLT